MKLNKHKRATMFGLNMTPMIDCVFLLLIFFMTVSQISATNQEVVELPKLPGSEDQEPSLITINVLEDGEIRMAGQVASLTKVIATVSEELALHGNDASQLTIVVRADMRSQSRPVNEIIKALNRLDVRRVRLAVEVPQ